MNFESLSSLATEDLDGLILKIEQENSDLPKINLRKQKSESVISSQFLESISLGDSNKDIVERKNNMLNKSLAQL